MNTKRNFYMHSARFKKIIFLLFSIYAFLGIKPANAIGQVEIEGELKKWHKITLTFDGPQTGENESPNPFRDYRLQVKLTGPSGKLFDVPGYFAADGNASETGSDSGSMWRVHFVPDEIGHWSYEVSFRKGTDIAINFDPTAGTPDAFDGITGSFDISQTDKLGRDHRAKGMLRYVGRHYARFAETGEFFLKGGADSPENFLAYEDFDDTYDSGGDFLHSYAPHAMDWRSGDPVWQGNKGKNIIGALNYLAGKGMNSVYFLTMNVNGDGKDVWPWTNPNERYRFDVSKLDQWEIVFSHMDQLGIQLHVVTQETENDQLLDGGSLGIQRKLYYRELIARFSHHLALQWNLGEENTNTDGQRKAFIDFIRQLDPYDHPIVVHTFGGQQDSVYTPLLGYPAFEGLSLQMGSMSSTHSETKKWIDLSAAKGRKWLVSLDEIGPANTGVKPDSSDPLHDDVRKLALWGNLMVGGAGVEWYFGYNYAHNDLNAEDWRSRENMWDQTRVALQFFQNHLPFQEMNGCDELLSGTDGYCLGKEGEIYAFYLLNGGIAQVDLPAGIYSVRWYNPRTGEFSTRIDTLESTGAGTVLNSPPISGDVAVLVNSASRSCTPGEVRSCPNQQGVCAGATETCNANGFWPGCDTRSYESYTNAYDSSEMICDDGLDNDCDGKADEDDSDCRPKSKIWLKAGSADSLAGSMTIGSMYALGDDADSAGDSLTGAMLYPDTGTANLECDPADTATYTITLPDSGMWYAWGRFYYPTTDLVNGANSFCLSVDGGASFKFGNNKDFFQKFHWDGDGNIEQGALQALNLGYLSAGEHSIRIYKRESEPETSPRLDFLLFTNDSMFIPTDAEAAKVLNEEPGIALPSPPSNLRIESVY